MCGVFCLRVCGVFASVCVVYLPPLILTRRSVSPSGQSLADTSSEVVKTALAGALNDRPVESGTLSSQSLPTSEFSAPPPPNLLAMLSQPFPAEEVDILDVPL